MYRNPLVVILGATGTGKSKLAVEIAKKFGGEVISADSMQVYKGLDIITNKVTEEETQGVKHHMIDFLEPPARFTVVDYRNKALPIIHHLHKRGILPVVVGGTNYYIESLVWKVLVEDELYLSQDHQELVLNRNPYEEPLKVIASLLSSKYLLNCCKYVEDVFLAYLQFRINAMPRFHDVIGDLLDSPANYSDSLLIHKATDVLDEIADYELGSIMMCTRYRWIMSNFRDVEKVLLDFVVSIYNMISQLSYKWSRQNFGSTEEDEDEKLNKLKEELAGTFRNLHTGQCLSKIEFSVSDHPIPAEYALLSLKMDELKVKNCFTEIRDAMALIDRLLPAFGYETLLDISNEMYTFAKIVNKYLLVKMEKIVDAEKLGVERMPSTMPSEHNPQDVHSVLRGMDPEMAAMLHPNDTRKVVRSIQVCLQKKMKHSEILAQQKKTGGGSSLGGPLRFRNTVIFWLHANTEDLEKRLDERVDDMMSRGLVKELSDFYFNFNEAIFKEEFDNVMKDPNCKWKNRTRGIFQSIGFKEFDTYLQLCDLGKSQNKEPSRRALEDGLANLRVATKRYAKKQNKWISQRFINTPDRHVPPVYRLDASDVSQWDSQVLNPAFVVVKSLLGHPTDGPVPTPITRPSVTDSTPSIDNKSNHYCETCERVFIGDVQWKAHIKSKKHQKVTRKKGQDAGRKKEKLDSSDDLEKPSTSLAS